MRAPGPTRAWVEQLAEALASDAAHDPGPTPAPAALPGVDRSTAQVLAERFARRVPGGYEEQVSPAQAALDVAHLAALAAEGAPTGRRGRQRLALIPAYDGPAVGPGEARAPVASADQATSAPLRLRRYGTEGIELSAFLPVLESFGLVVVEAVPTAIAAGPAGEPPAHIDDFRLRRSSSSPVVGSLDAARVVQAIEAVQAGVADLDSLNRLVLAAGLDWVQVRLLRAYRRHQRQTGSPYPDERLDDALVAFPEIARLLVELVTARFDPHADDGASRTLVADAVRGELIGRLGAVDHLEQDEILRGYLALVDATVRTSYFLRAPDGAVPATVAVKLDSRALPALPKPWPAVETFVHGRAVEGIHLRFGPVARGGIRWSDRAEDFRTEILDLAAAQVKKNAGIVPTGAKGGFVCRRPGPPAEGDAGTVRPEEVRAAYEAFISALLDLSDNLVDGRVVTPRGVVARDPEDPYLVVAADRGTATFSDLANALAEARGFWLGDAFASGGSHGYDHKAMGITARGAWVAVRRHFHQLGIDVRIETIRVAGVGDMSGDVFGNGMLQSPVLALVAAFDDRHVFIDPEPDAAASFAERARLAGLRRSSWADYDPAVISAGGGVWPRDAKVIPLAPAARRALGVTAEALRPPEVISAILTAPVDLLWFGGIGTFVKAPGEADADVGDHANDHVRVTADEVRARVIAEGGNLAVTQRARIRYSRRGGRINADFIDNAAGVATSDREVNLKILIDLAARRRLIEPSERGGLLAAVEGHVATEVLRQVDHSVAALGRAVQTSATQLDAYEALAADLEAAGLLDGEVEDLPGAEEVARRREAGAGLIRPELAVLLAYAKLDLARTIQRSALTSDPTLRGVVAAYFPPVVVERFGDLIPAHPLYRELLATGLGGEIVDQMGPVWAHETAAELAVDPADVAAAYFRAAQALRAGELFAQLDVAGPSLSADADAAAHDAVVDAIGALARRYLLRGAVSPRAAARPDPLVGPGLLGPVGAGVASAVHGGPDAAGLPTAPGSRVAAPGSRVAAPGSRAAAQAEALEGAGVPAGLRAAVEAIGPLVDIADAELVAERTGLGVPIALTALSALDRAAGTDRLVLSLRTLGPAGRWAAWQRLELLDDVARWRADAAEAALRALADDPALATGAGAGGGGRHEEAARVAVEWVAERASGFAALGRLLDQLDLLAGRRPVGDDRMAAERWALGAAAVRRLPR